MGFDDLWNSVAESGGWILAALLALVAIFRDQVKAAVVAAASFVGNLIYRRLAGSRLLRRRSLKRYRRGLREATERVQVPFRENRPLVLKRIYVALRIGGRKGASGSRDAWEVLRDHRRVVVTGPPGAGKSMLLRHLAAGSAEEDQQSPLGGFVPVLLELHRFSRPALNGGEKVEDYIVDAFARAGFPRADKFVRTAIAKNWLLLLLDGLDEVPTDERRSVAGQLSDFLAQWSSCPAVVTCRSAVYRGEFDEVCEMKVTLEPFEDQQIQAFLESWSDPMPEGKSPAQLMAALREQPQLLGAARNPLLLTIITHLYSDRPTYVLPRSRAEFYQQAAGILLEQWQERLGHNQFDGGEKRTVLSELALQMQEADKGSDDDRRTIRQDEALSHTAKVMPNLGREPSQAGEILREIVERSGLLLSIDGGTRYAFAHLTFQEYFAAEALLNRGDYMVEKFVEDRDAWREVVILWCGLVADCTAMVETVDEIDGHVALTCIAEARSVDEIVARRILDPVLDEVIGGRADDFVIKVVGSVAADIKSRGNQVLKTLVEAMARARSDAEIVAIGSALAASNRTAAAEAIVARLEDCSDLMPSLTRLGDLAVPALRPYASSRGRVSACACLASIATPEAATALVDALWKGQGKNYPAAWGIVHVIGNPIVEKRLAGYVAGMQMRSSLDWIWRPFAYQGSEHLCALVGFASELVIETANEQDAIAAPDYRISFALCGMDSAPLDQPIADTPYNRQMIRALNSDLSGQHLAFDTQGVLVYSPEPVEHSAPWPQDAAVVRTFGGLLGVTADAFRPGSREGGERGGLAPITNRIDKAQDEILTRIEGAVIWKRLVHGMTSPLRRFFLTNVPRLGGVDRESWQAVTTRGRYRLSRSYPYAVVLAAVGVLCALALVGGLAILFGDGGTVERVVASLCLLSIAGTWFWLRRKNSYWESGAWLDIPAEQLMVSFFSALSTFVEVRDAVKARRAIEGRLEKEKAFLADWELASLRNAPSVLGSLLAGIPLILFGPGVFWLAGSAIAMLVGTLAAIAILIAAVVAVVALLVIGERKEQAAFTPFTGLFADRHSRASGMRFPLPSVDWV